MRWKILVVSWALCFPIQPIHAATVYNYTGMNFIASNIVDDPIPIGSYTTAMTVSGSFTVASPLLNFSGEASGLVLSFSFSDGRGGPGPLTNLNAFAPVIFLLTTDAGGNITDWNIALQNGQGGVNTPSEKFLQIVTAHNSAHVSSVDFAVRGECAAVLQDNCVDIGFDQAKNDDEIPTSAIWSFTSDGLDTPLPAALPLFATGLGALGLLGWRRKRNKPPDQFSTRGKADIALVAYERSELPQLTN